jgi:hypothetical protein
VIELSANKTLHELNISNNNLGDVLASSVAHALRYDVFYLSINMTFSFSLSLFLFLSLSDVCVCFFFFFLIVETKT